MALRARRKVLTPPAIWFQGQADTMHDYRDDVETDFDGNEPQRLRPPARRALRSPRVPVMERPPEPSPDLSRPATCSSRWWHSSDATAARSLPKAASSCALAMKWGICRWRPHISPPRRAEGAVLAGGGARIMILDSSVAVRRRHLPARLGEDERVRGECPARLRRRDLDVNRSGERSLRGIDQHTSLVAVAKLSSHRCAGFRL